MKINVYNYSIQDAIKKVMKLKYKGSFAIINNIKLEAKNNTITMIKTDLEATVKINIQGDIEESGEMLLTTDTLKLLSKVKNDTITITDTQIKAGNKVIKYTELSVEEFPNVDYEYNVEAFTTTEKELHNLLSVKYCMSKEDNMPVFNGLTIDKENFIATDTHRLHYKPITFENNIEHPMTIPFNTVNLLNDYVDKKSDKAIKCFVSEYKNKDKKYAKIHFVIDNIELTSRLIDATMVNYKQIIPEKFQTEVTVNKKILLEELAFVQDLAKQNDNENNPITLAVLNNKLFIDAESSINGVTTEIDAEIKGEDLEYLAINHTFLVEALKQVENDEVTLKFNGSYNSIMIENALILPIRLDTKGRLNQVA